MDKALHAALRLIKARPRSRTEAEARLRKAGVSEAEAAKALEELQTQGFLNDEKFALWWAQDRALAGKYGPLRVRAELEAKGLSPGFIEEALKGAFPLEQQREALRRLKSKGKSPAGRGFDEDLVAEVFGYSV